MSDLPDLAKRTCDDCGELYDPVDGHDCPAYARDCPHCGEKIAGYEDAHDCDELPAAAGDVCPLCGQEKDSFLNHMSDCPGPEDVADQSDSGVDGTEPDKPTTVASVGELDEDR